MLTVLATRVVSVKSRMRKRGSALLLVVVLVLLLAMMGTAFLMTVRVSRDQITGTGSSAVILPQTEYWPAVPLSTRLAIAQAEIDTLITAAIVGDVHDGTNYRMPGTPTESAVNYAGTTGFLASRTPSLRASGAALGNIRWSGITDLGRPFYSPFTNGVPAPGPAIGVVGTAGPAAKQYMYIGVDGPTDAAGFTLTYPGGLQTHIPRQYPSNYSAIPMLAGRARTFPFLVPSVDDAYANGPDVTRPVLAADADGDGIADSCLFRLDAGIPLNSDPVVLQDGLPHPVTYWGAVRIVDNAGAVNVETAFRGIDKDGTGADITAGDALALRGAFRSNVGLYELVNHVAPVTAVNDDFNRLASQKWGGQTAASIRPIADDDTTPRTDTEFNTQGEAMDAQLVRRLAAPGLNYAGVNPPVPYRRLTAGGATSEAQRDLTYRFCLLNSNMAGYDLRTIMNWGAFYHSPNHSTDVRKRFRYYAANQSDFWFHSLFNTDSATGAIVDPMTGTRSAFFDNPYSGQRPNNPGTLTEGNLRKSLRHDMVAHNPISNAIAEDRVALAGLKISQPGVVGVGVDLMPDDLAGSDTPQRVNVNGASFGELWKAYWNVFAAAPATLLQTANTPTIAGWGDDQQRLTRAALAAINTIALREPYTATTVPSRGVRLAGFDVIVFGGTRQPFFTEFIAETDASGNATYAAVEIFNPYSDTIDMQSMKLYSVSNDFTTFTPITVTGWPATLSAGRYLVIQSGTSTMTPAVTIDSLAETTATADINLRAAVGTNHLYLLRTRNSNGTPTSGTINGISFNEANAYDLVPQDHINLSVSSVVPSHPARVRHVRSEETPFSCVLDDNSQLTVMDALVPSGELGANNTVPTVTAAPPIQIANMKFASGNLNPITAFTTNRFPFDGFAREGDILHVPFIGNYSIRAAGQTTPVPVGLDAGYARATVSPLEPIGRFIPMFAIDPAYAGTEEYAWTRRLLNHVTATSPIPTGAASTQHTPDVDPIRYGAVTPAPGPVPAAAQTQMQGRININTASWQVLASLPLVPGSQAATDTIAKAIVRHRDQRGPFGSIFDLNQVEIGAGPVYFAAGIADPSTVDYTRAEGDLSPSDGVMNDFEQRTQQVTRISNLITTRSDSFTAYVLIQAWIDAGTETPVMAAEHRYVLDFDRSEMTRSNGTAVVSIVNSKVE